MQHGVGGLLFQSGNITITHSKISDRLINNLTNIRSGVGIVKRTYNISTVMEMTPVLGLGVRLEGVSDDDGGELILGSPMEVRNSRVIVDGDMWSTEDVFLGNGMEDTVSFGGSGIIATIANTDDESIDNIRNIWATLATLFG